MNKKIIGIFVCTLMIATALPVIGNENIQNTSSAAPGLIGIKLIAKVFEVDDPYNLLGGVIHVNDTITGKYNYDSGTPDSEPNDPHDGKYIMTSSSCGFEVKAGGLVFKTNPSDIDFYLLIVNDYEYGYPHPDFYEVFSGNNLQLSNGMIVDQIRWNLEDPTGTVLSSDALPITAPVLADWESVYGLRLYGRDPSNPSKEYLVSAHVTRATKSKAVDIPIDKSGTLSLTMPNVQTAWSAKENNNSNLYQNAPDDPMGFITINLVAKVTSVADSDNLLKGVMKVNDTIRGKYIYDSGTPDSNPNSSIGQYEYTSSSFGFEVKAGGLVFKTNPSDVDFIVQILNNYYDYDRYSVYSGNNLQLSNGMLVDNIFWALTDFNATAISSDALPTTAPILENWQSNLLVLLGSDPASPNKIFEIRAQVTRATKSKAVDIPIDKSGTLSVIMPNVQTAWSAKGNNYSNLYQNAPADPMGFITIKLVAKVTSVIDYDNLLKGVMKVNDTITGKYVYDSGTLDTYSDPSIGHYEYTSSSFGFEVKAGGLVFKTNPSDVEFSIWIYNSVFYGSDEFIVLSSNNLQLSNGMLVTFIQWHLVDDNGTAIDSDALLTKAPVLADWKSSNTLMLGGKDPSDPNKAYMITAKVTRATKSKSVDTYDVKSELRTSSLTIPNQYNILFTQYMVKLFERLSHSFPVLRYLFGN